MQIQRGKNYSQGRITVGAIAIIIGIVTIDSFGIIPAITGTMCLIMGLFDLKK